jgi:hypothetical protein
MITTTIHVVIFVFVVLVVIAGLIFVVIDMFSRVDYFKDNAPWLDRILQKRRSLGALLLVAIFLVFGDAYELVQKEAPAIPDPPIMVIKTLSNLPTEAPQKVFLPAPKTESKCWLSNHFGFPNSKIEGAVSATTVIFHCNHKIEAPWVVEVQFDRDFIPGAIVLNDSGAWFPGGGKGKQGHSYSAQMNNPPLLSDQIVTLTVYGTTDQYPRAISGDIKALN